MKLPDEVLSYGGGAQTVAMCLLVTQGQLPRPDRIVMADTGREAASTWDYMEKFVTPKLREFGMSVELAPRELAHVDLYGFNGDLLLPAWTETGRLSAFCSGEWKASVIQRYLRSVGVMTATNWIGFSQDEKRRVKGFGEKPWFRRYPLLELMLTRHDCEQIILAEGWPLPKKSACWMCPHRNNEEWRHIRDNPAEWAQAIAIDEEIRLSDQRGGVWLHHSRTPLAQANIDTSDRREPVRQCGLGGCFL